MELCAFHLFAGAGGGILADTLLGHRTVGAIELEEYPRKILLARQLDGSLPQFPIWDDVTTFRSDNTACTAYIERLKSIRDRLIICGGFPCQDISVAGKGAGIEGERSGLWKEMARIICEVVPGFVFVENSAALFVRGIDQVLGRLAQMGYDSQWGIISAKDLGFCHERKRVWILANTKSQGLAERWDKSGKGKKKNCKKKESGGDRSSGLYLPESVDTWPDWSDKSILLRKNHGVANRLDRIKAIGNGQVPLCAAEAFRILMQRFNDAAA